MTRRGLVALLLGLAVTVVAVAAAGGVALWLLSRPESDCAKKYAAEEAKVRTDRRWTDKELPGIGEYEEIHWQVRQQGDSCHRAPGPVDYQYQGLLRLRPADARLLAERWQWSPVPQPAPSPASGSGPELRPWPRLAALMPAGPGWRHSAAYRDTALTGTYWGSLYLFPEQSLAFFTLTTH
jgi:hypothetical protein